MKTVRVPSQHSGFSSRNFPKFQAAWERRPKCPSQHLPNHDPSFSYRWRKHHNHWIPSRKNNRNGLRMPSAGKRSDLAFCHFVGMRNGSCEINPAVSGSHMNQFRCSLQNREMVCFGPPLFWGGTIRCQAQWTNINHTGGALRCSYYLFGIFNYCGRTRIQTYEWKAPHSSPRPIEPTGVIPPTSIALRWARMHLDATSPLPQLTTIHGKHLTNVRSPNFKTVPDASRNGVVHLERTLCYFVQLSYL